MAAVLDITFPRPIINGEFRLSWEDALTLCTHISDCAGIQLRKGSGIARGIVFFTWCQGTTPDAGFTFASCDRDTSGLPACIGDRENWNAGRGNCPVYGTGYKPLCELDESG